MTLHLSNSKFVFERFLDMILQLADRLCGYQVTNWGLSQKKTKPSKTLNAIKYMAPQAFVYSTPFKANNLIA